MNGLLNVIVILFVIAIPFQDFDMPGQAGGRFGNVLCTWLIPVALLLVFVTHASLVLRILKDWIAGIPFALWAYITMMSMVYLAFVLPPSDFGESHPAKVLKGIITFGGWISALVLLTAFWTTSPKLTSRAVGLVAIVCLLVLSYEFIYPDAAIVSLSHLHTTEKYNLRPRLWSPESSYVGAMIGALFISYAIMTPGRWIKWLSLVLGLAGTVISTSKGAVGAYGLGIVALILSYPITRRKVLVRCLAVIGIAGVFAVSSLEVDEATKDYAEYTSVSTRTMFLASNLEVLRSTPLGSGFSGYLHYGPAWMTDVANLLSDRFSNTASTREVDGYITEAAKESFFPKDLLTVWIWWAGIIGLIAFVLWTLRLLNVARRINDPWLWCGSIYAIVVVVGFESSLYQYGTLCLIGAVASRALRPPPRFGG